jgi:hypothetical protein
MNTLRPVKLIYLLILSLIFVYSTAAQHRSTKLQRPSTTHAANNDDWYILTSPDKDFIIEFPAKPERNSDNEAPSGTSRNYLLTKDSVLYQFSYVDTGFDPTDYDANQFPPRFGQELIEHAKENGLTVLRWQLLRINVFEYEVLSPRKGDRTQIMHWIERHIIRYGRQYTLSCGSAVPNQKVDARICHRFFESFRVIRAPQPQ